MQVRRLFETFHEPFRKTPRLTQLTLTPTGRAPGQGLRPQPGPGGLQPRVLDPELPGASGDEPNRSTEQGQGSRAGPTSQRVGASRDSQGLQGEDGTEGLQGDQARGESRGSEGVGPQGLGMAGDLEGTAVTGDGDNGREPEDWHEEEPGLAVYERDVEYDSDADDID
jgi:hypothetical protein